MEEILPLIDFSKVKKKKRTKQTKKNDEEDTNDLEDIVLTKKKGNKKKNKKDDKSDVNPSSDIAENAPTSADIYGVNLSYDFLLNRIYTFIKEHNPNSSSGGGGIKIPTPQVNLVGKTR